MIWAFFALLTLLIYFVSFAIYSWDWSADQFANKKALLSEPFVVFLLYPLLNVNNFC